MLFRRHQSCAYGRHLDLRVVCEDPLEMGIIPPFFPAKVAECVDLDFCYTF